MAIDPGPKTDLSEKNLVPMNRVKEWREFSGDVIHHIIDYAIPQYGDMPLDDLSKWSSKDVVVQLTKYISRSGSNARGNEEAIRDMLKIAHYAGVAYFKLKEELNASSK